MCLSRLKHLVLGCSTNNSNYYERYLATVGDLGIPSRLRNFIEQLGPTQLAVLVRNRIMQSMRADVSEEPVQANLEGRCLCASTFEYPSSDTQTSVSSHDLGACYPLCELSTLAGCQFCACCEITGVLLVDFVDLESRCVGQGNSSAQVSVEVAVGCEDVELVCRMLLVLVYG